MIRVDRGAEPAELTAKRGVHLTEAERLYKAAGNTVTPAVRDETDKGYNVQPVKRTLYERQHKKCAYCEIKPDYDENPIEHFRPKKEAWRHLPGQPKNIDKGRYWWLAWSWDNLLFSCHRCNGRSKKANYFPLAAGSPELAPLSTNTTVEQPLLLDPAEPGLVVSQHLRWQPVDPSLPPKRWTWELVDQSDRGKATKVILEPEYRADDVTDRFREVVWDKFRTDVLGHLHAGNTVAALDAWNARCEDLLRPQRQLVFATWCMLDELRRRFLLPNYPSFPHTPGLPSVGFRVVRRT